jgi:zinc/manganese transport system permease protein
MPVPDHSLEILMPAFLAGILVLATHVPLGQLVLERGIVFIDLAIAQVAGLGVIVANLMGWEPHGWSVQASAVAAALLIAVFLVWTEKRAPAIQEAIIGIVFVVAASAEILFLSFNPHGAEELKDLLVGQILWVTPGQLIPVHFIYAAVLLVWYMIDLTQRRALFYVVFAVTITASVQLVGVFLVFASLIIPALAGRGLARNANYRLPIGYLIGFTGYVIGLISSALFDFPTGPAIVCALALVAGIAALTLGRASVEQPDASELEPIPLRRHSQAAGE